MSDDESAEDNEVYMIKYASPWHAIADIAETVATLPKFGVNRQERRHGTKGWRSKHIW